MASRAPLNDPQYLYSPAVQATHQATYAVGATQSWDAFMRQSYDQANRIIQAQARQLVAPGNVGLDEARMLVEGQRNALVTQMRTRLSPWGRLYSKLLKPSSSLPTLEQLVQRKGNIEAVLESVGRSRASVNRFAATMRVAGPAAIVIQVTMSAVIIGAATPESRGRVAAGAWAGCAGAAGLVSPSLVLPVVGAISTGGACRVGGLAGAAGAGWIGALIGERAGTATYDFMHELRWTRG